MKPRRPPALTERSRCVLSSKPETDNKDENGKNSAAELTQEECCQQNLQIFFNFTLVIFPPELCLDLCVLAEDDRHLPRNRWRRRHTSQRCSCKNNHTHENLTEQKRMNLTDWQSIENTHSRPCSTSTSWVFWSGVIRANTVPLSMSWGAPVWRERVTASLRIFCQRF